MRDNPVSEEKLQEAAREYLFRELQQFDAYADYPEPEFHGSYKLQMAALRHDVKRGAIKEAEYRMGATFYIKRSIAAILLVFTMACLTMPETVLAGYQKLIEVIETVFEEYTEYRYRVNDVGAIEEEFRPLKLGYLPEGMEEVWREETLGSIDLLYKDEKQHYLNIYQKQVRWDNKPIYTVDSENLVCEYYEIGDGYVKLNWDDEEIRYIGIKNDCRISG
ncbi:MAG: hypothetical protein E7195_06405 [Peptococcaceae bacterium]|nr:hypothetical protein [Peptococcaceae bacterium]